MWSVYSSIYHVVDYNKIIRWEQKVHLSVMGQPHCYHKFSITLKLQIKENQIRSNQIPGVFRSGLNAGSTDVSDPRGLGDLSLTRLLAIYRFPRMKLSSTSCTFKEGHCGIRGHFKLLFPYCSIALATSSQHCQEWKERCNCHTDHRLITTMATMSMSDSSQESMTPRSFKWTLTLWPASGLTK